MPDADRWVRTQSPPQCPGINYESTEESGVVEFTDGETYDAASQELCYLGSDTASTPVDLVEDFDCESYVETAPTSDGYPYLVINTRETKTWNLGTSITGGLSCPEQLVSWCRLCNVFHVSLIYQLFSLSGLS